MIVDCLPTQAGPNAAQVQWFFGRLGSWSPSDWCVLAVRLIPRGLVARAPQAFEATGDDAARAGASQSLTAWGGSAWTAGRFFCHVHQKEMLEGVAEAARKHMAPRTGVQAAVLTQVGYDALKDVVLWAAMALAARPLIRPQTFEAAWAPFEESLRLLHTDPGAVPPA